uniref:Uncharacterized protein n=1 Tax=Arcella intermedia TaxID=1963864 RepID=A0A6B2LXA6_9EUKA
MIITSRSKCFSIRAKSNSIYTTSVSFKFSY